MNKLAKSVSMAIVAVATGANAQSEGENFALEEVLVTANKREQNLQDVAYAVTAIGTEALEAPAVVNLSDLAGRIPGLTVTQSTNSRNIVSIRGLIPTNFRVNSFPMVATYIDETPISEPVTPNLATYDLNRVEVLRGPQGTLYGESSMGGIIKYATNAPDLSEFYGSADVEGSATDGGGDNLGVRGFVNVPLMQDVAAARFVVSYRDDGGFIDNPFLGTEDFDAFDRLTLRGSVLVEPTDDLSIQLSAIYQDFDGNDRAAVFPNSVSQDFLPLLSEVGDDIGFAQFPGEQTQELTSLNLVVNYNVGEGVLTSSTSYYTKEDTQLFDESQTTQQLNAFLGGAAIIQTGTPVDFDADITTFSQEIRYVASVGSKLDYTVGLYYRDRELESNIFTSSPEFGAIINGFFGIPYDGFLQNAEEESRYKQTAVFGQATYSFTDRLRATVGLRYFNEDATGDALLQQVNPADFGVIEVVPNTVDLTEDDVIAKLGVEFDMSDDVLVYANFGQGFRPGGVNARFNPFQPPELSPRSFDSDRVNSYDVGIKTSSASGRLVFNAEAYFIDYEDPQFTDSRDPQFTPVTNAGAAETYGIEFELTARPTPEWNLGAVASFLNAEYTEDALPDGAGGFVLNAGQVLPLTRDKTFGVFSDYTWDLGSEADLVLQGDYYYASETVSNLLQPGAPQFYELDAINTLNLSLTYRASSYSVVLFGNNITDEVNELGGDNLAGIARSRPRTLGLRLGFDF